MKKRNYGVATWVFKCTSVMQNSHLPSSPLPGEEVSHVRSILRILLYLWKWSRDHVCIASGLCFTIGWNFTTFT